MEVKISGIAIFCFFFSLFLGLCAPNAADDDVSHKNCPGLYCGFVIKENGNQTECGACPRGYRPNKESLCTKCDGSPTFYDWLYLGFMALVSVALHWFCIDFTNKRKVPKLIILHVSAFIESIAAAVLTLLAVEPLGSLRVNSCPVHHLSDWYTMLYNPSPDYVHTIHCTQEVVYPLYSIVMVYYAFCLVLMMVIRPILSTQLVGKKGSKSIYAALYFFPILAVVQAICGGLLYYAFPYITLVISVATVAVHFSLFEEQGLRSLLCQNFTNPRNIVILVGHWILHAFGIIAITELKNPAFHVPLLALVPFPTLFYLLTVKFTHPYRLEQV